MVTGNLSHDEKDDDENAEDDNEFDDENGVDGEEELIKKIKKTIGMKMTRILIFF